MRVWRLAGLGCLLWSCGGNTDDSVPVSAGGNTSIPASGGSTSQWPYSGSGGSHTGGQKYSTYTAVGCPDSGLGATVVQECDLFSSISGCPDGQACFPTIRASADPCQPERFYYVCTYAGNGTQWDDCSNSNDCAQGHVCVVTSAGTKCQQMCSPGSSASTCPPGMFCDPIDVAGVGTCS